MCWLKFINSNYLFKVIIQSFYIALNIISIHALEKSDWRVMCYFLSWLLFPIIAGHFFHGVSICSILFWVTFATFFPPLLYLHCYSQVATIFALIRDYSAKLLFRRHHRAISYPHTLPGCTLSWYITEVYPILMQTQVYAILIHYRTLPYLETFPNFFSTLH